MNKLPLTVILLRWAVAVFPNAQDHLRGGGLCVQQHRMVLLVICKPSYALPPLVLLCIATSEAKLPDTLTALPWMSIVLPEMSWFFPNPIVDADVLERVGSRSRSVAGHPDVIVDDVGVS